MGFGRHGEVEFVTPPQVRVAHPTEVADEFMTLLIR